MRYQYCPECGVPLEISRQFSWDAERAMVLEKISGKRFILHNTNGIVAVVRVLREELGEDIDMMLTEITRDYARGYYSSIADRTSLDAELMKFPLRSWGRPVRFKRSGSGFSVRIVNPYSPPIVAGRVWGLLEAFAGSDMSLQALDPGESYLDMSLART